MVPCLIAFIPDRLYLFYKKRIWQTLHYHNSNGVGKSILSIQEDFLNAEKVWYQASAMIPHKFMPYYCLMQMYKDKGESIKAEEMANLILNKPIKIRSARLNEICDEAERMLSK